MKSKSTQNNNRENEITTVIQEFLNKVENDLPLWIKMDEELLKETLDELENHIMDRAYELSEGEQLSIKHIHLVLAKMGNPKSIADEYKKRGTPKYYISEELWPFYLKSLVIFGVLIFAVNFLSLLLGIRNESFWVLVGNFWEGIWSGIGTGFIIVTFLFVYLSMQGFLPGDIKFFDKIATKDQTKHVKTTSYVEKDSLITSSYRQPTDSTVVPRKRYKTGEFLSEVIMGIIFGSIMISFPLFNFEAYIPFPLMLWIQIFGILVLVAACISLAQLLVGNNLRAQQGLHVIQAILNGLYIPLFLQLKLNPILLIEPLQTYLPDADIVKAINIGVIVVIVLTALGIVSEFIKVIKLELYGFDEKKAK